MTKTLIAALALAGAAAFPALAQQDTTQTQGQQQGQERMQAQQGQNQQGQTEEQRIQSRIASQGQVREALDEAGFEEVTLLDAAYLVSARAPSGEMVMMVVNPSGLMQGMMQQGMGTDATGSTGMGQGQGQGDGQPMQNRQGQTNQ
jgi:hypothetical protein